MKNAKTIWVKGGTALFDKVTQIYHYLDQLSVTDRRQAP